MQECLYRMSGDQARLILLPNPQITSPELNMQMVEMCLNSIRQVESEVYQTINNRLESIRTRADNIANKVDCILDFFKETPSTSQIRNGDIYQKKDCTHLKSFK